MFAKSRQKNPNIFGRARSGSKSRDSDVLESQPQKRTKLEKLEREFEKKCLKLIKLGDWNSLESVASQHLEDTKCESFKGFFYLGVSFYKSGEYENAIRAFQRAEAINSDDA
jgi:tetratricopeptide (TPR) repeat protein